MASDDVTLNILAKVDDAIKSVQSFANKTEVSLGKVEKQLKTTNLAFASFVGNIAANLTGKVFDQVTQSAEKLFDTFVTDGVKAAQEQEDALNQLNFALLSTGKYTKTVSENLNLFASELEQTTKFSDDAILKNIAYLQSIANLDEKGLKQATRSALDFAAVTGKDLESAFTLIAKAAEGEVGAFKKLGIEIKKGADDSETFANTLRELSRFQGAAAADAGTFSGAIARLNNQFNNLQEAFGSTITQSQAFTSVVEIINTTIQKITKFIETNQVQIRGFFVQLISGLISGLGSFIEIIGKVDLALSSLKFGIENIAAGGEADNIKELRTELTELNFQLKESEKRQKIGISVDLEAIDKIKARITEINTKLNSFADPRETKILERQKIYETFSNQFASISSQIAAVDTQTTKTIVDNAAIIKKTKQQSIIDSNFELIAKEAERVTSYQKEIDDLLKQNEALNNIDIDDKNAKLQREQAYLEYLAVINQGNKDRLTAINRKYYQNQQVLDQEAKQKLLQNQQTFFSTASTLQNAKTRELQMIGKAAAITDIAIKTPPAVAASFEFGTKIAGPALGFTLAAIAATAMAAQAAAVAGIPLATGGVVGPGFPNDTLPARLSSGERVVNVEQNKDLTSFLARQDRQDQVSTKRMESLLETLINIIGDKEETTIVNIGNREIIREVRAGLRAGYSLEVS